MKRRLTQVQQEELGIAVRIGRAGGASWKLLANTYGRSREQLWRYMAMSAGKDVAQGLMQHLGPCAGDSATG